MIQARLIRGLLWDFYILKPGEREGRNLLLRAAVTVNELDSYVSTWIDKKLQNIDLYITYIIIPAEGTTLHIL